MANDKSKPLDDRQIGDIKAKGFRVQRGGFNEDIYVDPKTGLHRSRSTWKWER